MKGLIRNIYRVLRTVLFSLILTVIGIYALLYVAISLPWVQDKIRQRAEIELSNFLGSDVSIGSVKLKPFDEAVLGDVEIKDLKGRRCVAIEKLGAGINLFLLLSENKIEITYAELLGLDGRVIQDRKGEPLNIDFIVKALSPKDKSKPPTQFDLKIHSVVIRRSTLTFDRNWLPTKGKGLFDANHVKIENLNADVKLPRIKNDDFTVEVRRLAFSEQSDFRMKKLSLNAHITNHSIDVTDLLIELPNSKLQPNDFNLKFDGYDDIGPALARATLKLRLDNTRVTPSDFKAFLPALAKFDSPFTISVDASGNRNAVKINDLLVVAADRSLLIDAKLNVAGLSDIKTLRVDLHKLAVSLNEAATSSVASLLKGFKSTEQAADWVGRLGFIDLNLTGSGSPKAAKIAGVVSVAPGEVRIDATIDNSSPGNLALKGRVEIPGFDLGRLLANSDFGAVSADVEADVKIHGGDVDGNVLLDLRNAAYRQYTLSNLKAEVAKTGKTVSGKVDLDDPRIAFNVEGDCFIDPSNLAIDATANITRLYPSDFGVLPAYHSYCLTANADVDIRRTGKMFDGAIDINDFSFVNPGGQGAKLDRLALVSEMADDGDSRLLTLESDYLDARLAGDFRVERLVPQTKKLLETVMPGLFGREPVFETPYLAGDANLDFEITLKTEVNDLMQAFKIPFKLFDDLPIKGSIDTSTGQAALNFDIPYLQQGDNKLIQNIRVALGLDAVDRLGNLNASLIYPTKNDDVSLNLSVDARDDVLHNVVEWDYNRRKKYCGSVVTDLMIVRDPLTGIRKLALDFNPSQIWVNDSVWQIDAGSLEWENRRAVADNIRAHHANQLVAIKGVASAEPTDTLSVQLQDIDVDYIFETLNINYVTFGGSATGRAFGAGLLGPDMTARTDGLFIKDMTYNSSRLGDGDITGYWDNKAAKVGIGARITDNGRLSAVVDGGVWVKRDSLSFEIDANRVNVGFMRPFMAAFTSSFGGEASGKAHLFGTFSDIDLTGRINADSVRLLVDYTNVPYVGRDSVILTPGLITIPGMRLDDGLGGTAIFSGELRHDYFHEPKFDFRVSHARNLLCYNTNSSINPDWFGRMYGNGGGYIKGYPGYVGMFIDMAIAPHSVFTFVLNDTEAAEEYTFLTFTDRTPKVEIVEQLDTVPDFVKAFYRKTKKEEVGIPTVFALDVRADINDQGEMILVMDPVGGDKIKARGNGALQLRYSSDTDDFSMFGKYVLDEGSYNFTLQDIILRDFTIRRGSSISFNGDPYRAQLDIDALYRVNTSLTDLDKSFANDRDLNRTNVPIDAVLQVRGDMQAPDITFDLELPTLTADVSRKVKSIISTDDQMSRQILYLLALNRFYTPDYMGVSSNGGEWASVASTTLSSQITNMLGQLTDLVSISPTLRTEKGDFSDTEVDVALTSRLLNNRLLLNGNFGYRDRTTSNTTFVGDFDIEYLLNRNGNLRLKAYNHFNDQNYYLKSALTTQGVGIVFRRDFNDMFKWLRPRKKNSAK